MSLEGPRWRNDWLWVSDMVGRKVYRVSMSGQVECVVDVPGRPSGLGFLPDGTPLVVSMRDRCLYKIHNGKWKPEANVSVLNFFIDHRSLSKHSVLADRYSRRHHGRASIALGARGLHGPDYANKQGLRAQQERECKSESEK